MNAQEAGIIPAFFVISGDDSLVILSVEWPFNG